MNLPASFRGGRSLVAVALVCVAAGCGAERAEVPDPTPAAGEKSKRLRFPRAGMSLSLPSNLSITRRGSTSVFRGSAGTWSVSAFAYRRREQLPRNRAELEAARRRLVREVRRRGRARRVRVIRSRVTRVARAPAVEVVGDQTISRSRLRTRSVHVYKGRAEYVLELLAPVREFERADRVVFAPAIRSLRVTGRVRPPRGRRRGR